MNDHKEDGIRKRERERLSLRRLMMILRSSFRLRNRGDFSSFLVPLAFSRVFSSALSCDKTGPPKSPPAIILPCFIKNNASLSYITG